MTLLRRRHLYALLAAALVGGSAIAAVAGPAEVGALLEILAESTSSGRRLLELAGTAEETLQAANASASIAKLSAKGLQDVTNLTKRDVTAQALADALKSPFGRSFSRSHREATRLLDPDYIAPEARQAAREGYFRSFYNLLAETRTPPSVEDNQQLLAGVEDAYRDGAFEHDIELARIQHMEELCAKGAGACANMANRSQLMAAGKLSDLALLTRHQTAILARQLANEDRKEIETAATHQRFAADLDHAVAQQRGKER